MQTLLSHNNLIVFHFEKTILIIYIVTDYARLLSFIQWYLNMPGDILISAGQCIDYK